jgi:hypothetical protein
VPYSTREPSSTFVCSSVPILVSSSDDDSEFFELEPTPTPPLPRWVLLTREEVGDLVGDPSDQCQTRSQFQRASSLLAQVSETHDS